MNTDVILRGVQFKLAYVHHVPAARFAVIKCSLKARDHWCKQAGTLNCYVTPGKQSCCPHGGFVPLIEMILLGAVNLFMTTTVTEIWNWSRTFASAFREPVSVLPGRYSRAIGIIQIYLRHPRPPPKLIWRVSLLRVCRCVHDESRLFTKCYCMPSQTCGFNLFSS